VNLKHSLVLFALLALLLAAGPAGAQPAPQVAPEPLLAYIKDGNIWLKYDDPAVPDLALTNDAVGSSYSAAYPPYHSPGYEMPRWSPDGKWLAFIRNDNLERALYVVDVTADVIVLDPIAVGLETAFPPAWRDATILTYPVSAGEYTEQGVPLQVLAVSPEDPARETALLGAFNFLVGCGGATGDPAEMLYWSETASLGGNHMVFEWSGSLVIHTTGCDGVGIAAFDTTTQIDTVISEQLARAAVSPSRAFVAGVVPAADGEASIIQVHNLIDPNAPVTTVPTATTPGQLAWDLDSTGVYYSLHQFEGEHTPPDAMQERGLQVFGSWPVSIRTYFCGLHLYNLVSSTDYRIYTAPAHAMTSIAPLDNNTVLFTQIDNADVWLDVFERGGAAADLSFNLPRSYIIRATLNPAGAEIFLEDAGQAAVRPETEQ
jgi:hypothetical protein